MPWTGESFRKGHNHGMTPAQGRKAASIANAMMRSGAAEGMSIATANKLANRADGGAMMAPPAVAPRPVTGFLAGATPGRADKVHTAAPSGSYVIPADVVSALGDGNSLAGAAFLEEMLAIEPDAGETDGGESPTPVALSDGEYVVPPADVERIGGGDMAAGHRFLDDFVVKIRRRNINKLQSLPGPVGAKK